MFKAGNGIPETDAVASLRIEGLDPNDTYVEEDKCKFYKALLSALSRDNVGIKNITEGGYSISYDTENKAKYLYNLALESECSGLINLYSPQPKVTNKSNLW